MKHVLYGKCVKCGKTYDAVPDLTNCECGGILDIVYDYDYIRTRLTKEKLAARQDHTMWRYRANSSKITSMTFPVVLLPFASFKGELISPLTFSMTKKRGLIASIMRTYSRKRLPRGSLIPRRLPAVENG